MIRVYCGGLSNRIYAAPRVRTRKDGLSVVVGRKDDVTNEAIYAVSNHVYECTDSECVCRGLLSSKLPQV